MAGVDLTGNVADLVSAAASRGPEHPAFVEAGNQLAVSWAQANAAVDAEAARLVSAGVRPGDRVLVRLPQSIPLCLAQLGALRAGAIMVPASTQSAERELALIVADCAPAAVVAEPDDEVAARAAGSATVLGPPMLDAVPAAASLVQPSVAPSVARGGEDIAVLGYTSGSTGAPRGVRLSHRALLANRAQIGALRPSPISPADRVLLHLPLFHIYGLGAGLLQICWAGATAVLVDRVDPDAVVAAIHRERVTVVAGVPSMYRALLELPPASLRDRLVSVRLCTAGGAPLAPELLRRFHEVTGLELFEGYGLTETAPVLTSTLVGGWAKPGSVGRPLPGVQLRLVDADGRLRADEPDAGDEDGLEGSDDEHDTGLVAVRGPNLFSGYWPDGADGPDEEGWFRTSDVGYLDADGDLHLVNRANDLIIVNGFNVYPREVENVLTEHPAVAEAAVVGVPDERTGEAVLAVLVRRAGAELTTEQVRAHCATRLARFKIPSVVEFADRLPRSATGKITRFALRSARRP
ncbi:MAG: AMP-binding protein [Pseudonocardia sp.]|nr:AMP-binding protein [Pseudonocardia sp.]